LSPDFLVQFFLVAYSKTNLQLLKVQQLHTKKISCLNLVFSLTVEKMKEKISRNLTIFKIQWPSKTGLLRFLNVANGNQTTIQKSDICVGSFRVVTKLGHFIYKIGLKTIFFYTKHSNLVTIQKVH
jgi:hypothetical protein